MPLQFATRGIGRLKWNLLLEIVLAGRPKPGFVRLKNPVYSATLFVVFGTHNRPQAINDTSTLERHPPPKYPARLQIARPVLTIQAIVRMSNVRSVLCGYNIDDF